MTPRLNGDLQEVALTHCVAGAPCPDHVEGGGHSSRKVLGSWGWQGRLSGASLAYLREEGLNSSLRGSWPATWPHLAGLLSPQVTAAWALSSVKHFLPAVQSGTGNLLSHRPWLAKAALRDAFLSPLLSPVPSPPLSTPPLSPAPPTFFSPSTLAVSFALSSSSLY